MPGNTEIERLADKVRAKKGLSLNGDVVVSATKPCIAELGLSGISGTTSPSTALDIKCLFKEAQYRQMLRQTIELMVKNGSIRRL